MFEGFERRRIETSGATINLAVGGEGPPVLLLHGYPQSHLMWHRVAPRLAGEFTVIAPDLRGYGDSSKPFGEPDHSTYSKRAMAQDGVEVMQALGFERFAVVGHDRGGRVAYRMALDHPERVTGLSVLDIVPTYAMFTNVNKGLATVTYHWFFLIQPYDLPERLIGAEREYFLRNCLARWSGSGLDAYDKQALGAYLRCFDEATIHASCEDYRAGASIDFELDSADYGKRTIACPTLALYGRTLALRAPTEVWREWADDLRAVELPCGHFLPEEKPEETYAALREFLNEL
ncbi:MAG: alpha/beta hydrolase [Dehalococcoidia bacterium]